MPTLFCTKPEKPSVRHAPFENIDVVLLQVTHISYHLTSGNPKMMCETCQTCICTKQAWKIHCEACVCVCVCFLNDGIAYLMPCCTKSHRVPWMWHADLQIHGNKMNLPNFIATLAWICHTCMNLHTIAWICHNGMNLPHESATIAWICHSCLTCMNLYEATTLALMLSQPLRSQYATLCMFATPWMTRCRIY